MGTSMDMRQGRERECMCVCVCAGREWGCWAGATLSILINPLRAILFTEDINIYLHFMSFLLINKTQIVEIPPGVRQRPAYST